MILTITTTHRPATDLGYLLHKNPERAQTFDLAWGKAHVFYPEASEGRCTAALLLDIDPMSLVRSRSLSQGMLAQYVNDRPYVASSFMSVAIAQVFGSALAGRSKERPELAETPLPLEASIAALPCRGGESVMRRLFEPIGYEVTARSGILDEKFPEWGESDYLSVCLRARVRLSDLLSHLYVLIPVLDDQKHYWVSQPEIEKLLSRGSSWLASHPERELISRRYLKHRRRLVDEALARLSEEDAPDPEAAEDERAAEEAALEARISLNDQRVAAVAAALREAGARRVLDLGCGEGSLLQVLLADHAFTEIVGMDVSCRALAIAKERLRLDQLAPSQQARMSLFQGSVTYRDQRLAGYDAAAVVEVIEHLDTPRLAAFERVVFEFARPGTVIITTPNAEYNSKFGSLPAGTFRHKDHRFEWSRGEFAAWANGVAERSGYRVQLRPIGEDDPALGSPSQMAMFSRERS
ncbi:MAG: 3' terminal RNA ribose 2'-O-methyltransferase Hen1 [Armatimonadota bacterium]